nr:hypothetical protein Iba_chr12cCG13560 [Ipomoea batatas]
MSESREYFLLQSPPTIVVHASSPVHEKGRGAISALTLIAAPLCRKSFVEKGHPSLLPARLPENRGGRPPDRFMGGDCTAVADGGGYRLDCESVMEALGCDSASGGRWRRRAVVPWRRRRTGALADGLRWRSRHRDGREKETRE